MIVNLALFSFKVRVQEFCDVLEHIHIKKTSSYLKEQYILTFKLSCVSLNLPNRSIFLNSELSKRLMTYTLFLLKEDSRHF